MKKLILLVSLFCFFSFNLIAQDYLTVIVQEEDSSPIENAIISVEGGEKFTTNQVGKVQIPHPKNQVKPSDIKVVVEHFKVKYIKQNEETREFSFIMESIRTFVKGQIIDQKGLIGVARATVSLASYPKLKATIANNKGFFRIEVPSTMQINTKLIFKINEADFNKNHYKINRDPRSGEISFAIKIDKSKNPSPKEETKVNFVIQVYDANKQVLKGLKVKTAGKTYKTGNNGTFELITNSISKKHKFEIKGYKITGFEIETSTETAILYLQKNDAQNDGDTPPINLSPLDSVIANDGRDFNYIINKLEIEKQLLTENGIKIRQEMERIARTLIPQDEETMQEDRRVSLKKYHRRLENAFIENELAYQNARERTSTIIDEMKRTIWTEDSIKLLLEHELQKIEVEKEKIEEAKARDTFIFVIIVIILLLIVAGAFWAAIRIRNQRNQLATTKDELADKIKEIDSKSKKITDSIRYAKTIQQAILPNQDILGEKLNEYFLIFRPKDIVSGDFYWFAEIKGQNGNADRIFIAVVDCTGHGVPGAFMSMIGHGLLNEIILQNNVYQTDEVLSLLDKGIILALKQEEKTNDDGMDICLCCFEKQDDESFNLSFTGAKRPLYYIKEASTELQTLKGDNHSIGGQRKKEKIFTKQKLLLQKGDTIYLSTDGLADQNSPNRTKFGSQRLKKMLVENAHFPLDKQEIIIRRTLEEHQKNGEQRDDISLIGIKL